MEENRNEEYDQMILSCDESLPLNDEGENPIDDKRKVNSHGIEDRERQHEVDDENKKGTGGKSRARLKRLAFVGFGGTVGGIAGSVFVSMTAHKLHLSGLLIVAAILLLLSAESEWSEY